MTSETKPDIGQLHAAENEEQSPSEIDFAGIEADADAEVEADSAAPLAPQAVPKRKGGRKPIYATSEERKQRNRQAQAAFRERRTEYIKQLEVAIRQHEENLQTLQNNHRAATDECLMLRYKNSLLERILLERGIDVQAELHSKGEAGTARPPNAHLAGPSQPAQRMMINRHQQPSHRHAAGIAPKLHIKAQDSPMRPQHQHTLSSTTSASSQLASPSTTFSTPPTAHPHSAAGSPTFSPHQEFYPAHQRMSGQFAAAPHPPQQAAHSQQAMSPIQFTGQAEPQHMDFSAAYPGYEMNESSYPAYPSWMDQGDMSNLGKLNPFLSPSIYTGLELSSALYDTIDHDDEYLDLDALGSGQIDSPSYGINGHDSQHHGHERVVSSTAQESYLVHGANEGESYEDLVREFAPAL